MEKILLGCAIIVLASCTNIQNHHLFDQIADLNISSGLREMRTDGYYWKAVESKRTGRKGLVTILFFPGGYQRAGYTPAYIGLLDSVPDSLNTFEHARANFLAKLPTEISKGTKDVLHYWGCYHADSDSIAFATLVDLGVALPVMLQTYRTNYLSGVYSPDSGFNLGDGWYHFEKLPQPLDSSGLKINTPKFKKKKFPGFYLGW